MIYLSKETIDLMGGQKTKGAWRKNEIKTNTL